MAVLALRDFSFAYPDAAPIIRHLSLTLERGEMLLLCGENGCGKSTLLRCLKAETAPKGKTSGTVQTQGESVILFQECDKNIIFKSVWEDLIFAACNYGVPEAQIKTRAAEMLRLFDIEHLSGRDTSTLSGGEKQLLSLACLMMLQPNLLILDEPLAQLDEDAKETFIDKLLLLKESGTAIIIAEHQTDRLFEHCEKYLIFTADSNTVYEKSALGDTLPIPNAPEYLKLEQKLAFPIRNFTAAEAVENLKSRAQSVRILAHDSRTLATECVLELHDIFFSYQKDMPLLSGLDYRVQKGEISCITGKNGAGKSTLLSLICGFLKTQGGEKRIADTRRIGYLAQNPIYSFLKDTVEGDLRFAMQQNRIDPSRMDEAFAEYPVFADLKELLQHNPLDLSGGERAKAAIFKLLLLGRDILILDEPEKHLDKKSMEAISEILRALAAEGISFIIVSHSPDFIYRTADSVHALEGGTLTRYSVPEFFPAKWQTALYRAVNASGLCLLDWRETEVQNG